MNKIRRFYVYLLYYIGDIISKTWLFNNYDRFGWLYTLYTNVMTKSKRLQDRWGFEKPWYRLSTIKEEYCYRNMEELELPEELKSKQLEFDKIKHEIIGELLLNNQNINYDMLTYLYKSELALVDGYNDYLLELYNFFKTTNNYNTIEIPNGAMVLPLSVFISTCKSGGLTDEKGCGYYVVDNKLTNVPINPSFINKNIYRDDMEEIAWFSSDFLIKNGK